MSADDDDLFRDEMAGVTPLQREQRVVRRPVSANKTALEHRRSAAVAEELPDRNKLTDTSIAPLDPWYVLSFKRPGVQNGVFRKLKQGRYEAQARLDLHRMTVERARREIFEFVEQSYQYGVRSALIIHGKGETRPERERASILKGCVDHWLRELDIVQAFHSALPQHGGTGAVYVLLRKSEEKKREAREQFAKGRVSLD